MLDIINKHNNLFLIIINYLFVFFTILFNTAYFYQPNFPYIKYVVEFGWQILLIILCVNAVINSKSIYNKYLFIYIFMFLILFLSILTFYYVYFPYSFHYIFEWAIDPSLLIIYFYCSSTTRTFNFILFRIFEQIMVILAIISLICYVLYFIGIKPNSGISVRWGGTLSQSVFNYPGYFDINFFPMSNYSFMGINMLRNTGIFTEAPVYSYFLYAAFLINLFVLKYKKLFNYKLIILLIAIFSTLSTTGMILSLFSILIYILLHYKNILLRIIFIVVLPLVLYLSKIIFFEKKNESTTSYFNFVNSSYYVRHDDLLASIHAWLNHIIIGNGIGNLSSIYKYINPLRIYGDMGITSDFFELLAFGGIILILLYILPTLLSYWVSSYDFCFAIFNFIVFLVEGILVYKIYIIILSFLCSRYLWSKLKYKKDK